MLESGETPPGVRLRPERVGPDRLASGKLDRAANCHAYLPVYFHYCWRSRKKNGIAADRLAPAKLESCQLPPVLIFRTVWSPSLIIDDRKKEKETACRSW